MGRWMASIAAGLMLAIGAAGCGSGEDDAREVLDAYLAASEERDARAACELWSPWVARDFFTVLGIPQEENCDEIDQTTSSVLAQVVVVVEPDPEIRARRQAG